jgi:hypothetical protein
MQFLGFKSSFLSQSPNISMLSYCGVGMGISKSESTLTKPAWRLISNHSNAFPGWYLN